MKSPHTPGRNIIVVTVLLLAILLPIVVSLSYFQDTPTISAGVHIETATQSATQFLASETPRPAPPTRVIKTANPAQGNNCTYPATYWLISPENWPAEITIGNLYYTQDQAIEFVTTNPAGVFNTLFIQLHAAYLNILAGASQSQIVGPMIEASDWLNKTLYGSITTLHEEEQALELARLIQAYNDGETGPGRCLMETTDLELFSDKIPVAALSLTPEISMEAAATNTPGPGTPTAYIRTPGPTFPPSTLIPSWTPTRKSDSGPPALPTSPPPTQQPTATTAPPTPRPTSPPPTVTPRPAEPTPTSAPPEEPTPTSPAP